MDELLKDRYRLGQRIGSGGMAAVYDADDTALGRRVAVKVMHPQYSGDEAFVARFDREARAIAALNHPGIVGVYDVGRTDGKSFMVLERVEGQSVKELVAAGPLSVDQTIDIGSQVARALDYAHSAGIVHRDIKSHNILVARDGAAKLLDFGIAVTSGAETSLDDDGTVLGTVHYVAPERARGEPASPASDIYSLGVVLYEMATGKLPFEGDDIVAIATQHVSRVPVPPTRLNPKVPLAVERAILHALQKDPAARPASAGELARELLLGEPGDAEATRFVPVVASPAPAPRPAPAPARPWGVPSAAARPVTTHETVEVEESSSWPIVALALVALMLVLGLIPLWTSVLRGLRG